MHKKQAQDSAREYDLNGWAEIKGNPISKVGVFPYLGSQISPELEPDRIYHVYRPEEELSNEETIKSFRLIPWTDEHAMLGSDDGLTPAERKGIQGVIGEDVFFEDGYLKANLKIFSNKMAELIDQGKRELSIGYRCLYDIVTGVYNGVRYDAVQRQIRGNHVALVTEGRSGHDVAVLDHFKFTFDTKGLKMAEKGKNPVQGAQDEEITMRELYDIVKGLADSHEAILSRLAAIESLDEDEKERVEVEVSEVEEEDEAADPAMLVSKTVLNEDESEEEKDVVKVEVREEEKDGMDAAIKNVLRDINKRDSLVKRLAPHIGVFDHKDKTLSEVAKYAAKRLNVSCEKGHEAAAVEGYLAGAKQSRPAVGQDSRATPSNCIDAYLRGEK